MADFWTQNFWKTGFWKAGFWNDTVATTGSTSIYFAVRCTMNANPIAGPVRMVDNMGGRTRIYNQVVAKVIMR